MEANIMDAILGWVYSVLEMEGTTVTPSSIRRRERKQDKLWELETQDIRAANKGNGKQLLK